MENNRWASVTNKDSVDGKTWEAFGVRSLELHVAKLIFLESKWSFIFSEIQQFYKKDSNEISPYFLIMKVIVKLLDN